MEKTIERNGRTYACRRVYLKRHPGRGTETGWVARLIDDSGVEHPESTIHYGFSSDENILLASKEAWVIAWQTIERNGRTYACRRVYLKMHPGRGTETGWVARLIDDSGVEHPESTIHYGFSSDENILLASKEAWVIAAPRQ